MPCEQQAYKEVTDLYERFRRETGGSVEAAAALTQAYTNLLKHTLAPLLSVEQAAEYLNVSVQTVYQLVRDGVLRHVRVGRVIRLDRADLLTFVRQQPALGVVTTALPRPAGKRYGGRKIKTVKR